MTVVEYTLHGFGRAYDRGCRSFRCGPADTARWKRGAGDEREVLFRLDRRLRETKPARPRRRRNGPHLVVQRAEPRLERAVVLGEQRVAKLRRVRRVRRRRRVVAARRLARAALLDRRERRGAALGDRRAGAHRARVARENALSGTAAHLALGAAAAARRLRARRGGRRRFRLLALALADDLHLRQYARRKQQQGQQSEPPHPGKNDGDEAIRQRHHHAQRSPSPLTKPRHPPDDIMRERRASRERKKASFSPSRMEGVRSTPTTTNRRRRGRRGDTATALPRTANSVSRPSPAARRPPRLFRRTGRVWRSVEGARRWRRPDCRTCACARGTTLALFRLRDPLARADRHHHLDDFRSTSRLSPALLPFLRRGVTEGARGWSRTTPRRPRRTGRAEPERSAARARDGQARVAVARAERGTTDEALLSHLTCSDVTYKLPPETADCCK